MNRVWLRAAGLACVLGGCGVTFAMFAGSAIAEDSVPHGQIKAPGPPLSPAQALEKMTVPDGFTVELVASEPDIVNPVAMTFDEQGRIWITESLEYPRREAGPGRDRVKVLEDTDGDGAADKFTVFADGLNIPSGIAVGAGGVWVANAPDILFMTDEDGDGRADKREVVVTGFGRDDTHELPNSLTWGPDGWLYGLNGVFNRSVVEHRGKKFDFTCALFRIHPRTRDFELFAEGTSNPWGVAWDAEGSAFVSACVIDHLWHLTESGYYHRQGGPYPPFAWKIESIVRHKHQQAAYCGIHYFDSDAYPPEYRNVLFMGNIHGNCINCDTIERDGSTYFGRPRDDFLSANDAWFMPVVQKTGPDGCLYVLDWYDRYHCYQDANRDPAGIDRLKGRLYRIRHKNSPRLPAVNLAKESDSRLIDRLASGNGYRRDTAQRLLRERALPATRKRLETLVLDGAKPRTQRLHALWALVGMGPLEPGFHGQLLSHEDATFRAWGVRAAGNARRVSPAIRKKIESLAADASPDVRLQTAIAARKIEGLDAMPLLVDVLQNSADDKLIPQIVWQNLHPLLETASDRFLTLVDKHPVLQTAPFAAMLPRLVERVLGRRKFDSALVLQLYELTAAQSVGAPGLGAGLLDVLATKVENRELAGPSLEALRTGLAPRLQSVLAGPSDGPLFLESARLAAAWGDAAGAAAMQKVLADVQAPAERRLQALGALAASRNETLLSAVEAALGDAAGNPVEFRRRVLDALGRLEDEAVASVVLAAYPNMEPELKPQAIELLTGRTVWAKALLGAIGAKQVPAEALNANQVRKLLASKDDDLARLVAANWGALRTERNPQRDDFIAQMRQQLRQRQGDAFTGAEVFKKVCGQCHKIYGAGQEVGPDITVNGRSSFAQLLSNVFDPSLVVGAAYRGYTIVTVDGRVVNGLLVEDNEQRVVLRVQGGKLETIARGDIDESAASQLSLMPEGLEKQLMPQELADLFAYLTLDRPPTDPAARQLPGVRAAAPRESTDAALFPETIAEVAEGFSAAASGEGGMAIVETHMGREGVLRTHPVDRETPCTLEGTFDIPASKRTRLSISVAHDERGDWKLDVKVEGQRVLSTVIGPDSTVGGWADLEVDLTPHAGKRVKIELLNRANDWSYEFAYWGVVRLASE